MANKIIRIIVGIAILAAILVGGYFILPGSVKWPLTQWYQENFDDNAKAVIDGVAAGTVPSHKGLDYKSCFEAATDSPGWHAEKVLVDDVGNGSYDVFVDGYKCTVTMPSEDNDAMKTLTNAHVRLVFHVEKSGTTLKVGGKEIEAGKKVSPDQVIVAEETYGKDDAYYQKALDALAAYSGGGGEEE